MNEVLSNELWTKIRKLAQAAKRKHSAIAYVTDDRYIKFGSGDVLVTDASDASIVAGQTNAQVLKSAKKRGAEIVSIAGLHAKVYVFDRYAIIGSANLSRESERRVEAAILTDQPTVVSSARTLVEQLRKEGSPVDDQFIERICKLKVARRKPSKSAKHRSGKDIIPRTWLVGLKPVQERESEIEVTTKGVAESEEKVHDEESSVSWVRMTGSSKFRREAREGDVVISIWSDGQKSKPKSVYRHAPILLRKDDESKATTWFFIEDFPDAEETALSWAQFKKLYAQVCVPGKLSQWATKQLSDQHAGALHELWST